MTVPMPTPGAGQADACPTECGDLRLLQWLGRRGCVAVIVEGDDGPPEVRVLRDDLHGNREDVAAFRLQSLQGAAAAGLVIKERNGDWRLSEAGRRKVMGARSAAAPKTLRATPAGAAQRVTATPLSVNDSESPLAWLRRRRDAQGVAYISEAEFAAGERLRIDFTLAQMTPRVTVNWSAAGSGSKRRGEAGGGVEMSDRAAAAGQRVRNALAAVGPEFAGILLDVCCFLKGLERVEREARWPQRSAKFYLQMALRSLARHYRIAQDPTPPRE